MTATGAGSPLTKVAPVSGVGPAVRTRATSSRTCAYRSCRCEFDPPGWGRYCSERCLTRDFDEMDGVA